MEKELEDLLTVECGKYLFELMDVIKVSPRFPKLDNEHKRLSQEILILLKSKQMKVIWFAYLLSKEAKKYNEPYFVRGTLPDLYLLYVLEITKFNPIGTDCCYQACLGTYDKPKESLIFDISFRKEFVEHMRKYASTMDETVDVYHYSYNIKEKDSYSTSSMIFVPKAIDINKYFVIREVDNVGFYPILGEKIWESFNCGVRINILGSSSLSILYEMQKKHGDVSFYDAFEDYKLVVGERDFSSSFFIQLLDKYPIDCLDDAYKVEGMSHSTYKDYDNGLLDFGDRETIFYYFHNYLKRDESLSYDLMECTRKGRFVSKEWEDIPKTLGNVLENILYLFSRGHVVETTYYRILLAHYYKLDKNMYLKLVNLYNK